MAPQVAKSEFRVYSEPVFGNVAFVADAAVLPGRQFAINCSVAGNVEVTFLDGSTLTFAVVVGFTVLPWAVTGVVSGGTTATATYANLK